MTTPIDIDNLNLGPVDGSGAKITERWTVSATTTDVSGDQVLKIGPGTDLAFYVTDIFINCVVTATIIIGEEDDSVTVGTFEFLAAGPVNVNLHFDHPVKLTDDKDLEVDSGAIVCSVIVQGYTA